FPPFRMSSTPAWLEGLINNKETLVSKLDDVGFLGRSFVREVESDLGAGIDAVMKRMNEIERLEAQLKTSEEDSVAARARQFLKDHDVILDEDVKTAVAASRGATPPSKRSANLAAAAAEEEESKEGVKELNKDELEDVPKYMKGRLTLAEVNEIVHALSACLKHKHELLSTHPNKLSNKDKDLVYKWREQGSETSSIFCMDTEVRDRLHEKHKKNLKTVLPILRHVKRIREQRDKGAMRIYPLVYNA
ncbi:hypothetical protein PFISCL1PPCAC_609, partial [Pristionchus fissidentatus]